MHSRPLPVLNRVLSEAEALAADAEEPLPFLLDELDEDTADIVALLPRPSSRTQCRTGVRPCPWVSCRYNLYLDVRADGILRINFPDREPEEMTASCSLDLAEDGPRTLDQVAALMGMSRERARQIEEVAMGQLRRDFDQEDLGDGLDED